MGVYPVKSDFWLHLCQRIKDIGLKMEKTAPKRYHDILRLIERIILICIPLLGVIFILDIPQHLGIRIWEEQYLAIFLGLVLANVFLFFPAAGARSSSGRQVPWYDIVFIAASLAVSGYLVVCWPDIVITGSILTPSRIILGVISFFVLMEATRRIYGLTLVALISIFIFYALFTELFPGPFYGRGISWERLAVLLYLDKNALLGITLNVAGTMVLPFILFGQLLFASGAGQFFNDLALSLFGRMPGAPAKVPIVASSVFGSISGVAVANVYTTGQITIPMMKKYNVNPALAGAIEATASTGGLILPPVMGVVAFIMAVFLNTTYAKVCIAAAIPAILYYFAIYIQIDRYAAARNFSSLSKDEIPSFGRVVKDNWIFFLPLAVLVYTLFATTMVVELCAVYATGAIFLVSLVRKQTRINLKQLMLTLEQTGRGIVDISVVCAVSGFLIGVVMITGLGFSLTRTFVMLSGGSLFPLLVMSAAICILLGMGMPIVTVYILAATLIVPGIAQMGISEMAAHMFVFYFGMLSFLTPPVMLSIYAACSISGASPWQTAWKAMRLGISAYIVPFIFIYNPALLFEATASQIAYSITAAFLGIGIISLGIEGYVFRKLTNLRRTLLIIGGMALLWPTKIIDIGGICLCAAILIWEFIAVKNKSKTIHSNEATVSKVIL